MTRRHSPKLAVLAAVSDSPGLAPPDHLDGIGLQLWRNITREYAFDDAASYQILADACACAMRAERCRALINEHGELFQTKYGPKPNPLIRDETQLRALTARLLEKLGLSFEPIQLPGRPAGR
jgi:hypothetical protein